MTTFLSSEQPLPVTPEITSSFPLNILIPVPLLPLLQAFFNDKYIQEHPEDLEKIEKLKDLIAWQVRLKFKMHTHMIALQHHRAICKASVCLAKSGVQSIVMFPNLHEFALGYSLGYTCAET